MRLPPYVRDFARRRDWTRWVQSPWESFWLVQGTSFNCLHEDSSQVSYRRRLLVLYPASIVKWRESVQSVQGLPACCLYPVSHRWERRQQLCPKFKFILLFFLHGNSSLDFPVVLFWILRQGPVEPRLAQFTGQPSLILLPPQVYANHTNWEILWAKTNLAIPKTTLV